MKSGTTPTYWWGIDIGGTNVQIGRIDNNGHFFFEAEIPTCPEESLEALLRRITDVVNFGKTVSVGIGIGIAGIIDHNEGLLITSPNLPGWEDILIAKITSEITGLPAIADNDSNTFALGGIVSGEIPDQGLWLVLTLGTGIGSSIILDGELLRGRGFASEAGHMTVQAYGIQCPCGSQGCWERYAGRSALLRYYLAEGGNRELTDPRKILEMAEKGDIASKRAFDQLGFWLGVGLANLNNCLFPHGIAIAGGLSSVFNMVEKTAKKEYLKRAINPVWNIKILDIASHAGAYGAACLARLKFPEGHNLDNKILTRIQDLK